MGRIYIAQIFVDFVAVGDVIDVKVLNVDAEKGRIGLSMVL